MWILGQGCVGLSFWVACLQIVNAMYAEPGLEEGTIAGVLLRADGTLIAGETIWATSVECSLDEFPRLRDWSDPVFDRVDELEAKARTGPDGRFVLEGLKAGRYFLDAECLRASRLEQITQHSVATGEMDLVVKADLELLLVAKELDGNDGSETGASRVGDFAVCLIRCGTKDE